MPIRHYENLAVAARRKHGRRAGDASVVGVHRQLQPGVVQRFDEQGQILAPVTGHDAIGP